MNAIRGVWRGGRIVPRDDVDWPEGTELLIEPVTPADGLPDDAENEEALVRWEEAVKNIQPTIWAPGEREELEQYQEKFRQFNLDAVRKQMEGMSPLPPGEGS